MLNKDKELELTESNFGMHLWSYPGSSVTVFIRMNEIYDATRYVLSFIAPVEYYIMRALNKMLEELAKNQITAK